MPSPVSRQSPSPYIELDVNWQSRSGNPDLEGSRHFALQPAILGCKSMSQVEFHGSLGAVSAGITFGGEVPYWQVMRTKTTG